MSISTAVLVDYKGESKLGSEREFVAKSESQAEAFGDTSPTLLLHGPWGSGKCLAPDTMIIRSDGIIVKAGDVAVGDYLMGKDSMPREVLHVYSAQEMMYEVCQSKASNYTVNKEHILTLQRGKSARILTRTGRYRPRVVNIPVNEYLMKDRHWCWCLYGYRIVAVFPSVPVLIDPYFLGLWLGDGDKDRIFITTIDEEIISYIRAYAERLGIGFKRRQYSDRTPAYGITNGVVVDNRNGHRGAVSNALWDSFCRYDLFRNKHIPNDYLYNTRQVRLDLLAGIIDADGSLTGNCYDLIQKDEAFAWQIHYLASSLGLRCSVAETTKHIKSIGFTGKYFRLNISGHTEEIPVRLARKRIEKCSKRVNPLHNGIKEIRPVGFGDYVGFTLDQDGYFLLRDFTVLHNTHCGAAKAYFVGRAFDNNCVALVRKKRVDLVPTLWKKFIEQVLPPSEVVRSNDSLLYRRIRNGTEFWGCGLDSTKEVTKMASREYGFIVVEEAKEITEDDFETQIMRCLRLPGVGFHQAMLLSNPDAPAHWLYGRFFMNKLPGYREIQGQILPDLPPIYYQRLDQLTGFLKLRYRDGKWVAAEGMVYPFDPTKHLLTMEMFTGRTGLLQIPADWKRVLTVDFGFDHPFVCQWWAISPDDIWYLYREIYMTNRLVSDHAKEIVRFCLHDGIEAKAICDHDAHGAAVLRSEGVKTINAKKDRLAGQQDVYGKFEHDQVFFIVGSLVELDQRLLMNRRPTSTVEEFATYLWANRKTKEDMVKEKDDGMDAMRYAIHTLLKTNFRVVASSSRKTMEQLGIR